MIKYKGILTMNDGTKAFAKIGETIADIKRLMQEQLKLTTRYYKRNGVDYGERGKLFTFEEEHNGVATATIYKVTTEFYSDITAELK